MKIICKCLNALRKFLFLASETLYRREVAGGQPCMAITGVRPDLFDMFLNILHGFCPANSFKIH